MKGLQQEKKELEQKLDYLQRNNITEESNAHDNLDLDEIELEDCLTKHKQFPLNREPIPGLDSAHIIEDGFQDGFIAQEKPFRSNWTLPNNKKRKAPPENRSASRPEFPLKMDSKGRLQGTVQLGSRKKMAR